MVYSSPEFILLFVFTLCAYLLSRKRGLRFCVLLSASLTFYAWAGIFDTAVFLCVIGVSWTAVAASRRWPRRAGILIPAGIAVMTGHLLFWKYVPWLCLQVQNFWPGFLGGLKVSLPLPIGISFFTLQGIAYLVDFRRGQAKYMTFSSYMLFKTFFAQLVAGPIVRAKQLLPQLETLESPQASDLAAGLSLFVFGFAKKLLVADRAGQWVDAVFADPGRWNREALALALAGYTVQIWADFSGYTDMGRGCARMLGLRLPENFMSPYLSRTPSEFWRRWHITLSEWIRDYVYIPLGGSRGGALRTFGAVVLTMGLSGLWHGANWTFACWGLYHGGLLVVERYGNMGWIGLRGRSRGLAGWALTLAAVIFGWLLFRSPTLPAAGYYLTRLFSRAGGDFLPGQAIRDLGSALVTCALLQIVLYRDLASDRTLLAAWLVPRLDAGRAGRASLAGLFAGAVLAVVFVSAILLRPSQAKTFIYFQF